MKFELTMDEKEIFLTGGDVLEHDAKNKLKQSGKTWYLTSKRLVNTKITMWLLILLSLLIPIGLIFIYFMKGKEVNKEVLLKDITKINKEKVKFGMISLEVYSIHTATEKFYLRFSKKSEMINALKEAVVQASGKIANADNDTITFT